MKAAFVLAFGFLIALPAHAAPSGYRSTNVSGAGPKFVASGALTGGLGKTVNKDKSIPEVDMSFAELALDAGIQFNMIAPVVQASYRQVGQTTKTDSVNGINMAGSGYLLGFGLGGQYQQFGLQATYQVSGQYDLTKKSAGGSKVSYTSPAGFHGFLRYNVSGPWQFVFSYSAIEFKKRKSDGVTTDLKDNPVKQTLYGIGVGYAF